MILSECIIFKGKKKIPCFVLNIHIYVYISHSLKWSHPFAMVGELD